MRAYVPELGAHGIREADFVTFIDGLNEAFIAHPLFQGLGIVGGVMSMFYGVTPVQWAGAGLQVASGVASAATSYFRTRAYIKAVNQDLFHPSGLHLNIMSTKNMMKKVGYPEDKLQLPPLESNSDLDQDIWSDAKSTPGEASDTDLPAQDDPRMRRVRALQDYVMPIDLDVPAAVAPESLFRRMEAARAAKQMRSQERQMTKRRTKGETKYQKKSRAAAKKQRKGEERIEGVARELASNKAVLERRMTETQDPKQQDKAIKTFEKKENKLNGKLAKRMAKMDKKVDKKLEKVEAGRSKVDRKEARIAHKVRWIVISPWNGGEGSDEDSLPGSESEVDAQHVV